MPYKSGKLKLPEGKDKRIKLTPQDKEEIRNFYGKISQRKLAKAFGVSRRLIIFVGDSDKYRENLEKKRKRWSE